MVMMYMYTHACTHLHRCHAVTQFTLMKLTKCFNLLVAAQSQACSFLVLCNWQRRYQTDYNTAITAMVHVYRCGHYSALASTPSTGQSCRRLVLVLITAEYQT